MSTATINKEEDLIILNDDSSSTFDLGNTFEIKQESKVDENIISFDEEMINIQKDNIEKTKTDDNFEISFDLGGVNEEIKIDESIKLDLEETKIQDVSIDLFSENKSEEIKENTNEISFDLDSIKEEKLGLVEEQTENNLDMFGKVEVETKETKTSLDNSFNRNSILDEAITKLETRKETVTSIKTEKDTSKTTLLKQIEDLKSKVSDIESEIDSLDDEITSIDSDIDSIKTLLEMQENKIKRTHDSKKLKS